MIVLLLLYYSLNVALRMPVVQTFITAKVADFLSDELQSRIEIDRVHFQFFDQLEMDGLYVEDQQGDTLLYCNRLRFNLQVLKIRQRVIEFDQIQFDRPHFYLHHFGDSIGGTNLDFIVNYFKPEVPDTSERKPIALYSDDIRLNDARFKFRKDGVEPKGYGIDFADLDIRDIQIDLEKVELLKDTLYAETQHISLKDDSGFAIDDLSANLKMSSGAMWFSNLNLITPNSRIQSELSFEYDHFRAFRHFVDSVYIRSDFTDSDLDFTDISYFAPNLEGFSQQLQIDGKIRGVVKDIKGRNLKVGFGDHSYFIGDCDLTGLPDVQNTFVDLDIQKMSTTTSDLIHIQLPPFTEDRHVELPDQFDHLGTMVFSGEFVGFYNDFVAFGTMRTDIGKLSMDIGFTEDKEVGVTSYSGELQSESFHFGKFFEIPDLSEVSSEVKIEGKGLSLETINADVEGEVSRIIFRDYSYEGIRMNANLEKNLFNGQLQMNDANLSIDFDGLVDLRSDTAQFDFVSNLYHANPGALNLIEMEEYSSLTSRLEVNVQAVSLDNFKGKALALSTRYCVGYEEDVEYDFGDIALVSSKDLDGRRVELTSDVVNAKVWGKFETIALPNSFLTALHSVLPALVDADNQSWKTVGHEYEYEVEIKDFSMINELMLPKIDIGDSTTIAGKYNGNTMLFDLKLSTDYFRAGSFLFENLNIEVEKNSEVMALMAKADKWPLSDSLYFEHLDFRAIAYQDQVDADLSFSDQNTDKSNIPIQAAVLGKQQFEIAIDSAEIFLLGERWYNDTTSMVFIDTTSVRFQTFEFTTGERRLMVDGTISENMEERLDFHITEFDIALLNPLTSDKAPKLSGILNAEGHLEGIEGGRAINSNLDLRKLQLDDHLLGRANVDAFWNFNSSLLDLSGYLKYRDTESIALNGTYDPGKEESPLNAEVSFTDFDLSLLEVFIKTGVSEFEGRLSGDVEVVGDFNEPLISGELDLKDAGVKVNYLNTKYFLSDKVVVAPDYIGFDYIPIRDQEGNKGHLVGTLFHENFRDLNYNFYVEMRQLLALNTSLFDNDLFYGKAYSTGSVDVTGYDSNVQIEVTASTSPGTYLYLPLGGPTEVSLEKFVTFVSSGDEDHILEELDLSGITLIMDLQVTPDLQVELVFDESLGDVLRARGSGNINLEISPDGDFSMFGRYEIAEGEYLFTLQNIINKRFTIEKGGVIGWYGDPYNADIDVTAEYKTRASLADLMGEFAEGYTSRVPVHLQLGLTNKLLNPNVDFSVYLPSADESMQNLVNSVLSSEEEKNMQAFALLVLNRFLPPSNRATASSSSLGGSAIRSGPTDVISGQLSNWLSQISEDFNVGLNYRPGDNITNEELAVALSTQLLSDRLLLSGSFGVSNTPANVSAETNNQVIGDFMAEYLITEEGKLRLKVFSESADYNILQSYRTGTVQGAGITYQEDFDNFADLACQIRNLLRKKNEKVDCDDLY